MIKLEHRYKIGDWVKSKVYNGRVIEVHHLRYYKSTVYNIEIYDSHTVLLLESDIWLDRDKMFNNKLTDIIDGSET